MHIGLCPGNFYSGMTESSPLSEECLSFRWLRCELVCELGAVLFSPLAGGGMVFPDGPVAGAMRGRGNMRAQDWNFRYSRNSVPLLSRDQQAVLFFVF